jgi:antitoxin (DNA-binding transcriptional repressor) of toxin-antitoxin stability system
MKTEGKITRRGAPIASLVGRDAAKNKTSAVLPQRFERSGRERLSVRFRYEN